MKFKISYLTNPTVIFPVELSPRFSLSSSFNKLKIPNSGNGVEQGGKIMVRQLKLTPTFRSIKPNSNPKSEINQIEPPESSPTKKRDWYVYLIASTNSPFKTYVGVTTNFSRRLKQHNGELKGGAKASRAGRPWVCACIVQGFCSQNQACEFESKWKIISRKMTRKRNVKGVEEEEDKRLLLLLQHRYAAMEKLKDSFDFSHLEVDWQLSPS